MTTPRWIKWLAAVFAIGTLDLLFAWGYWAAKGVTLTDILHSIAAGWYGREAHSMGATGALVGALSHYAIMGAIVLAYVVLARRWPALRKHPVRYGAAYGLGVYAVMSFVVLPLSAAGWPDLDNTAWVASSVSMHALIGILAALAARRIAG